MRLYYDSKFEAYIAFVKNNYHYYFIGENIIDFTRLNNDFDEIIIRSDNHYEWYLDDTLDYEE